MNRNRIAWIICVLALLVVGVAAPMAGAQDKRPNILFAFADDWGRYASAYAALEPGGPNDAIRTPSFDRVAREGVLFTNAFVPAPSCTPCRSTILSGQYFYRTGLGAILQGAIWDSKIPSYPLLLRDAGYHIGQTYKVWSPGSPNDAPYGEREHEYENAGRRFNSFSQQVARGDDKYEAMDELFAEVDANFEQFLADRKPGQPFCYWFGPTNVHRKWVQGSGLAVWGVNPDDLKGKMPPFLPDVPIVREDMADYFGEVVAFDTALGRLIEKLREIGELENTLIVVSGDHGIPGFPRGKCNLYDFGVGVALAVRWGQRVPGGRVVSDFVNLMDLAPTFLEAGGVKPPDVMTGRSLMNVITSRKAGQVDPQRSWVIVGRERHVGDAREDFLPYPQRALRTANYLYIRNFKPERWPMGSPRNLGGGDEPTLEELTEETFVTYSDMDAGPTKAWLVANRHKPGVEKYYNIAFARRPGEELYDLRKDPHQMHNVADDPAYQEARKQLHDQLMAELKRTNDPRVMGDGSTFDKPPYAQKFERPARQQRNQRGKKGK